MLNNGYAHDMLRLLSTFGQEARLIEVDGVNPDLVAGMPLLLIPSGGLIGVSGAESLKAALGEYAGRGGTILAFAQQRGADLAVLPGGVAGYGWQEDQSCQANSSYIDEWHPMLSGQTRSTPSVNIDGYFTTYPDNTTVLLRRTANGQPALVTYPVGQGRVIAAAAYPDYAYTSVQAHSDEIRLVRDMVSWAVDPVSIAEVRPGQAVTAYIDVTNSDNTVTATLAEISVLDPNKKETKLREEIPISIPPGQSAVIPVTYTPVDNAALGIHHIRYGLLAGGYQLLTGEEVPEGVETWVESTIQPPTEAFSGRFAVSNPPSVPFQDPNFSFSITSEAETYLFGSTVPFTFTIYNRTDAERAITTLYHFPHHYMMKPDPQYGCSYCFGQYNADYIKKTLNVPPQGSASFVHYLHALTTDRLWAGIFDNTTGKSLGRATRGIFIRPPNLLYSVSTDKQIYGAGETVNINTTISSEVTAGAGESSMDVLLKISVHDILGTQVAWEEKTVSVPLKSSASVVTSFVMQKERALGSYVAAVSASEDMSSLFNQFTTYIKFEHAGSRVSITPQLPSPIREGVNVIPLTVSNTGKVAVANGTLEVTLRDPQSRIVYSGAESLDLAVGESKTIAFPVLVPTPLTGYYFLDYVQSDPAGSSSGVVSFANRLEAGLGLDNSYYNARETAKVTASVSNVGTVDCDNLAVTLSIPAMGYTDTRPIGSLAVGSIPVTLDYSVPVPADAMPGRSEATLELRLPSGSSVIRKAMFMIPESRLILSREGTSSVSAGDTLRLNIENAGGVDTTYTTETLTVVDNNMFVLFNGNASGAVLNGERKPLADVLLPSQAPGGPVYLSARVKDARTGARAHLYETINVTGLSASLSARTDKQEYLSTESISGLARVANGGIGIDGGSLKLSVTRTVPAAAASFQHVLPKEWWPISSGDVAIAPDGAVYVADTGYGRILKFDSGWNLLAEWIPRGIGDVQSASPIAIAAGPDGAVYVSDASNGMIKKFHPDGTFITAWGSGDGQLLAPGGIAVGPDGAVYVVDTSNRRIQKFEADGTFITTWGSYGTGDGQFRSPVAVDVAPDGTVYVTDTVTNGVQRFDGSGSFLGRWGAYGSGTGRFNWPRGIAVGSDGSVYVSEVRNSRIQVFDAVGNYRATVGTAGRDPGELFGPRGIAVDPAGRILVADSGNYRVQKFDAVGTYISKKGGKCSTSTGWLGGAEHVAAGPDGSIYVADSGNSRVQKFDADGNFIRTWGYPGFWGVTGAFNYPTGIGVAPDGSAVFVVDHNSWVQKFDADGNFINAFGWWGFFFEPLGLAVAPDGSLYVADTYGYQIQHLDSSLNLISRWGGLGSDDGKFKELYDVTVGPDGVVYAADTMNNRIQKFDANGNFITKWNPYRAIGDQSESVQGIVAGPDDAVYLADTWNGRLQWFDRNGNFKGVLGARGTGTGQFDYPIGMSVERDGTILVSDWQNCRIQRMVPPREGGSEQLFEATIPVTQLANADREYTVPAGPFSVSGKLTLNAELKNSTGQTLAKAEYPFYVVGADFLLKLAVDRKFYRPGDTVTLTGEAVNFSSIPASGLSLALRQGGQTLHNASFDVPAGGRHPFTVTATASAEGRYVVTGSISHNGSTLAEVSELYEVARPVISASVSAPAVAGNEPVDIEVELKNEGKADGSVGIGTSFGGQAETVLVRAGESRVLQYRHRVMETSTYTFTFTGDLQQSIAKTITYGVVAAVSIAPQTVYPEGGVDVPVTLANNGSLDGDFTVSVGLSPSSLILTRSYPLPAGGSVTDTFHLDLAEGDHQVFAAVASPPASTQAAVKVRREIGGAVVITTGSPAGGMMPVTVGVENTGGDTLAGTVRLTASDLNGSEIWTGDQPVAALPPGGSASVGFGIDPSILRSGSYLLTATLSDSSGRPVTVQSLSLEVAAPLFRILQLPPYQTFYPGQPAQMSFVVANTGGIGGAAELGFKTYDAADTSQKLWIGPGESKTYTFLFELPGDLEEKDYEADYRLATDNGSLVTSGQVRYHLAGLSVRVDASLDKPSYMEGDVAHLTLSLNSPSPQPMPLFARVNYTDFESQQPFSLSGGFVLTFDIPMSRITGEKLFYGIYHESGRSLHLNSLYVYRTGDPLTIVTDRQVYDPSAAVAFTVTAGQGGPTAGTLLVEAPGYSESMPFSGSAAGTFTLPPVMSAGTYEMRIRVDSPDGAVHTAMHPFDVKGRRVSVLKLATDKGKYPSGSTTINANYVISSNTDLQAVVKGWVMDPQGNVVPAGQNDVQLSSARNVTLAAQYPLASGNAGIHRLVYEVSADNQILTSGVGAFEYGNAMVLGLSTDKAAYPSLAEPILVKASIFGSDNADVEFFLDGESVRSGPVALGGVTSVGFELPGAGPGRHILQCVLRAAGLSSIKETSFVYGSDLPDLVVNMMPVDMGGIADNAVRIGVIVTNRGKTPSEATSVDVYDGGTLIGIIAVGPLSPGETGSYELLWNVLGNGGTHTLQAVVDTQGTVGELDRGNNTYSASATVPDLVLATRTEKEEYNITQDAILYGFVVNLTSGKTYGDLSIVTSVTDPSGLEVYSNRSLLASLAPSSSLDHAQTWSTRGLSAEGVYTITQSLTSADAVVAKETSLVMLHKAPDFVLATGSGNQVVKQGAQATYQIFVDSMNGWNSPVSFSIQGLPAGAAASFSPALVAPPAGAIVAIATTGDTPPGTYALELVAEGVLGQEVVRHTQPLVLDVSAFGVEVLPADQAILQLEEAVFEVRLTALNGFEGNVSLTLGGADIKGLKASLSRDIATVPAEGAAVSIQSSKYLKPGHYSLNITATDGLVTKESGISLTVTENPAIAPGLVITPGPGPANSAWVRLVSREFTPLLDLTVFDSTYGATAVMADLDGDGYDEIIAVPGPDPNAGAVVRVYRKDGTFLFEQQIFETKYGLTLAKGDFDGDWKDEIVVGEGPDPKNVPRVVVLRFDGSRLAGTGIDFQAYGTGHWDNGVHGYGVNVAVGDVDGDGQPELISAPGPGPGNRAVVKVFGIDNAAGIGAWTIAGMESGFTAYYESETDGSSGGTADFPSNYGATIAAGDVDGDGIAEIVVGAGPDPKHVPVARVYRSGGAILETILVGPTGTRPPDGGGGGVAGYGVSVGSGEMDGNYNAEEIIIGLGFGPYIPSWLKVQRLDGTVVGEILAYPDAYDYGVKVSIGRTGK